MKRFLWCILVGLYLLPSAHSAIGFNAGVGVPFVSQYGVNLTLGQMWSLDVSYNNLSYDGGTASLDLTMPAVMLNFHPFSGSFYIGVGMGKETLTAEAGDSTNYVKAETSANTTIGKLGWMWGKSNGGFWFGMDIAYISPSGADDGDVTYSGSPSAEDLNDLQDAIDEFGETAYMNITFARFGWLF